MARLDLDSLRHGACPPRTLNHTAINLGIPGESAQQAVGIIPEFTVIETGAWIGPRVCFTNARWPASRKAKDYLQGVHIEPFVRIGANSTILPGVRIGRGAIIGAGAVVTKDVPPGVVMAGNPARQIKTVAELRYPDDPETLPYPDG
ncbi:MAG: acyltransferase [Novosphingobium sp.]|nr:acyltransferase [Novosphingobium sp.]MCZ8035940.1 acyltransferase [Novosphingobium sp.]